MKISSKGEYGLRALFDLAQHFEQNPRRSREIAEAQGLQEDYLNQLLITLRKAGLINSLRGPQGGHVLARPPHQITLYEIIRELEGDISPVAHAVDKAPIDNVLNQIWSQIEQETMSILQSTTLADLTERFAQSQTENMYYI
ncbi:MAG TPA: Rrf2 family transcriptional regulator [Chloroflexia bacterium]|nr:Rrf2 family transcriptional regulator [Chloroflexia bacterium]